MTVRIFIRVRRADGAVLAERALDAFPPESEFATYLKALMDADHATVALDDGWLVLLEVMDPDGDIAPAGEWVPVIELSP